MRTIGVLLLLLLAGCAAPPTTVPTPTADAPHDAGAVRGIICVDEQVKPVAANPDGSCPLLPPKTSAIAMDWDSQLGTGGIACADSLGQCTPHAFISADGADWTAPLPGGNVTAADVTLTWTAMTPATQTLGFRIMVLGDCAHCNLTDIGEVTGVSPLHIQKSGLHIPGGPGMKLYAYAWNPQGVVNNPPLFASVSAEQAVHGSGNVTVETVVKVTKKTM
jgi:hypothetical protein